jgi:hypothetical protein
MHDSKFKYSLRFAQGIRPEVAILAELQVDYIVALWIRHNLRAERLRCVAISRRTIGPHLESALRMRRTRTGNSAADRLRRG